jgi:hypothetical protein
MIHERLQAELFKQQMRESLRPETLNSRVVTIAKLGSPGAGAHACGPRDNSVKTCSILDGNSSPISLFLQA